jgi:hypothetical protein
MIASGDLKILSGERDAVDFLDDLRVGLHLARVLHRIEGPVDLRSRHAKTTSLALTPDLTLEAGRLYLAATEERIALSDRLFGFLSTRSKYARLGLELVQSSTWVIPGFGAEAPAPLVFEIAPRVPLRGLVPDEAYGFLLLFLLEEKVSLAPENYGVRFPLRDGMAGDL